MLHATDTDFEKGYLSRKGNFTFCPLLSFFRQESSAKEMTRKKVSGTIIESLVDETKLSDL